MGDLRTGLHGQRTSDELTRKATLMFPGYYHTPPKPVSTRVRCPVCHQEVYSMAGIHPQCAVKQSESKKPTKQTMVVTDPAVGTEHLELLDPITGHLKLL
jgi:hypothetical protein